MPKVSIILPVYNSEKYIASTIDSILSQTFKDWELIIVDDCSTDNSLRIIEKYQDEKIILLKNDKNLGAAISRNKALNASRGKYIAYIDSDDIWEKEKLEKQLEFMLEKNIEFSFSAYKRIQEDGTVISEVEVPSKVDYKELLKNTIILTSTVIIDTSKIEKKLLQMPDIKITEDTAMFLKVLKTGCIAYGMNSCLIKHTVRKDSLSSNKFKSMISLWNVYKIQENLGFFSRVKNICGYAINATQKRTPRISFKRIKEIFHYLSMKQILDVFLFPFIWIISVVCKPFCPSKIWIVEENPYEACDNGYIFFKYLRENRKDINAYYVIKKASKDYKKVEKFGNIIEHGSLKHWIYYLNANKIIVTQKYSNPSRALFYVLHTKGIIKTPRIYLKHGIIKDDCKLHYYNRTKFRLFICGARREYEYVKAKFEYPVENVKYTGLARFDNLDIENKSNNKIILLAPTWRNWIKSEKEFESFMENYYNLINNNKLKSILEENEVKLQFVLHKNMNLFKMKTETISKNIVINHNSEIDIQDLINKADLLITDYSSIFMDIAYRQKPIIYYQFDLEQYRDNQLQEGYFSYEKDGFGAVLNHSEEVIDKIKYYIEQEFNVEDLYKKRMKEFFERKDKNNCKRILEEIEKI